MVRGPVGGVQPRIEPGAARPPREQARGVLPLVRRRGSLLSATNWHTPEYSPLAEDDAVREALVREALANVRGRLDLSFLPEDEPMVDLLERHGSAGEWWTFSRPIEQSPYVALEGSWEDFEAALPSKRRSDLRRRLRRLGGLGAISVECSNGGERLADRLREGWALEAMGWKGRAGTAVAARRETLRFYRGVAEWGAAGGWLRLFLLRAGEEPIAFAFCLADSRSHYVLKIGFDPAHARFAPGMLLTRAMLSHAFDAGLETYEFLGQADPYKLVWTDRLRVRQRVQVFPRSAAGVAERLAWQHGRPLIKRLLGR